MTDSNDKNHFSMEYVVAWVDTDALGIVHFSNYFRLCERTEQLFFESKGLYGRNKVFLPRVHASCDYLYPMRFRQRARVEMSLKEVGKRSLTFEYTIVNESEGKVSAKCRIVVASVEENMRPVEIDEDMKKSLREILNPEVVN